MRGRLLKDVCNPSTTENIEGGTLTQTELVRVPACHAHYVDEGLRETARRLLGWHYKLGQPMPMHTARAAIDARAACARYLDHRIQSDP